MFLFHTFKKRFLTAMSKKTTPSSVAPDVIVGNWTKEEIPSFSGMTCFVLNGAWFSGVVRMMALAGFQKANSIDEADVVVFTGGSDINPKLYGEEPIKEVRYIDKERDLFEEAIYRQCVKAGKIMFGICRGAQFLWAMNGGKLWQHVEGHAGPSHYIIDLEEDVRINATSVHHQAMCWDDDVGATLLAIPEDNISHVFKSEHLEINLSPADLEAYDGQLEVEAAYVDKTKCFMVQGHPEVGCPEYVSWTMTKLFELALEWTP